MHKIIGTCQYAGCGSHPGRNKNYPAKRPGPAFGLAVGFAPVLGAVQFAGVVLAAALTNLFGDVIRVTRELIGQLLKIELLDHVIMGNPNHYSLP